LNDSAIGIFIDDGQQSLPVVVCRDAEFDI
jgi:hypothetical protein